MKALIVAVFLCIALGGCAGLGTVSSDALEKQAAGVVAALDALPPVPADAATQAQVEGWKTWLAYLAKAGSAVAGAALKARGL
ncbi:MAG: hypothetical protein ACP59X_12005 [Solidesulfovibrio sp. DCME]|uniref:hypothetical protein n=1 Tax=Solidesulfovibrio sp. DCME TaxID=3447380 RepID=UPI003D107A13